MKKRILIVLILSMLVICSQACGIGGITGSGNLVTRDEAVADFDSLDISFGFNVDVQQGSDFSVVIRVNDNVLDRVQVVKQGSTLRIGLERSLTFNIRNVTLEADVTMPKLTGLELSGGSHVDLSGFSSAENLSTDLSGGSHLQGAMDAGDVSFEVSGGSHVTLSGSAGNLTVDASGGSHVKLGGMAVADATVDASGGSHVTVNSSGELDAAASGGSHVSYLGSPTLGTIDADNASSIQRE